MAGEDGGGQPSVVDLGGEVDLPTLTHNHSPQTLWPEEPCCEPLLVMASHHHQTHTYSECMQGQGEGKYNTSVMTNFLAMAEIFM